MKTSVTIPVTKTTTYDRAVVNGREFPLTYPATVAIGDTLTVNFETAYPLDADGIVLLEVGQRWAADVIFDYFARDLARRRPHG